MSQSFKDTEIENYVLPDDVTAPENFNPDVSGYVDPPVGKSKFRVTGFEIVPDNDFKIRGETYRLDQLRPKLQIMEGEHAGATIIDFLPLPTGVMHEILANRWGQFIKRLGFQLKPGQLKPDGFKIHDIIGRDVCATVQVKVGEDGQPQRAPNGKERLEVAFFGYDYPDETTKSAAAGRSTLTTTRKPPTKPAAAAAAPAPAAAPDFDL